MTLHAIDAAYAIETKGPLHIGTGQGAAGLHRAMLRDHHGVPYIPGSTLKGRARYATIRVCEWLNLPVSKDSVADVRRPDSRSANGPHANRDLPERIFGTAWSRCTLRFTDARAAPPAPDPAADQPTLRRMRERAYGLREVRTGAARSRHLGTVSQGLLYRSEVAPPGLVFHGAIRGTLECKELDDQPVEALVLWLALHLMVEDGVGGNKSAGNGKLAWARAGRIEMTVDGRLWGAPDDATFSTILELLGSLESGGGAV